MAVPSRVFVGLVIFGLIASLALVPFTILVLTGYEPEDGSPLLPGRSEFGVGDKLVLILGSLFGLALTYVAWRGLVQGARHDAKLRKQKQGDKSRRDEPPPGYH
jgi:hypothetical protein